MNVPCWELFERQDDAYRSSVLPPDVPVRLAVEAASPFGWHRWVGDRGGIVGIDGFGASAPGAIVMENYGFTATKVAARALELVARSGGDRPRRAPRRKVDGHT